MILWSIFISLPLVQIPYEGHRVLLPQTISFLHAITCHVSCQHSPLHTRAKNHVPTPPRRQHVAEANADFAEVSSPCPKVIIFLLNAFLQLSRHTRDFNTIVSYMRS
jgi:hypothetical protein